MRDSPRIVREGYFTWLGPAHDDEYDLWAVRDDFAWVSVTSTHHQGLWLWSGLERSSTRELGYIDGGNQPFMPEVTREMAARFALTAIARARSRGLFT